MSQYPLTAAQIALGKLKHGGRERRRPVPNYDDLGMGDYPPPRPDIRPSMPSDILPVFEALLRVCGGGITMAEGRVRGLSGKLVVTRDGETVTVRTLDLAQGKWAPAEPVTVTLTDEEIEMFAGRLIANGVVKPVQIPAKYAENVRKEIMRAIQEITKEAQLWVAQAAYLEGIQKEDEADERQKPLPPPKPTVNGRLRNRGVPRG